MYLNFYNTTHFNENLTFFISVVAFDTYCGFRKINTFVPISSQQVIKYKLRGLIHKQCHRCDIIEEKTRKVTEIRAFKNLPNSIQT